MGGNGKAPMIRTAERRGWEGDRTVGRWSSHRAFMRGGGEECRCTRLAQTAHGLIHRNSTATQFFLPLSCSLFLFLFLEPLALCAGASQENAFLLRCNRPIILYSRFGEKAKK